MTKKKIISEKKNKLNKKIEAHKEERPEYMIQINEPKMLRKDLLESLREIIIFMQGYEKFLQIQAEKVKLFSNLKADVNDLNSLIENKLKRYFPQGRLKGIVKKEVEQPSEELSEEVEVIKEEPKKKKATPKVETASEEEIPSSELDELESQLKDIEGQLRSIQ